MNIRKWKIKDYEKETAIELSNLRATIENSYGEERQSLELMAAKLEGKLEASNFIKTNC